MVNVHEAKTKLSKLLAQAEAGNEVVIARNGTPVARLEPVREPTNRRFGTMAGLISIDEAFHDPLPESELALWDDR